MTNTPPPETISWSDMTAAGIDTDLVERTRDSLAGVGEHTWVATSADGTSRIYFGVASDPQNIVADGEHKGWEAIVVDLETRSGDDHPTEYHDGNHYYEEPGDVAGILALVARIAPMPGAIPTSTGAVDDQAGTA